MNSATTSLRERLKDIRWRVDDTRTTLMSEGIVGGGRTYGCDEWSTPTVNLARAIEKIDEAIAALSTPPAGEWMPIASAPKDGTHVWLGAPFSMRVGFWHSPAEGWIDFFSLAESGSQRTVHFTPTHWQPLPQPPEPATQGVE